MNRILCLLLALMLCCAAAMADHGIQEEYPASLALDVTVDSIRLNADAFSPQARQILTGVADLLDIVTLRGNIAQTYAEGYGNTFRTKWILELNHDPATDTDLEIYGTDTHYYLESSLLNDQKVMLNIEALLEFAMKTYYHLEMPLQYAALLAAPYATASAFQVFRFPWEWFITNHAAEGLIPREEVLTFTDFVQDVVNNPSHTALYDREEVRALVGDAGMTTYEKDAQVFIGWINAVFTESGLNDVILAFLADCSAWADALMDETGILVTRDGDRETWTTNGLTLFTHETAGDRETWCLTLPETLQDCPLTLTITAADSKITADIAMKNDETVLLEGSITAADLPAALPFEGETSLAIDLEGDAVLGSIHLLANFRSEGEQYTFTLSDSASTQELLTITGTWRTAPAETLSFYFSWYLEDNMLNLLSVNDRTLPEFVNQVKGSIIKGILKLAAPVPASAYQSVFEFLDQYNIMDVLAGGL